MINLIYKKINFFEKIKSLIYKVVKEDFTDFIEVSGLLD